MISKICVWAMLFSLMLYAKTHYARVEPIDSVKIKAAVEGRVLFSAIEEEGKELKNRLVVKIDDRVDRASLKSRRASLALEREALKLNAKLLPGLKSSYERKKSYYERMESLETASRTQKDNAYEAMVAAYNQYIGTLQKSIAIKEKIAQLESDIERFEDRIEKKSIVIERAYLYRLYVRKGEYLSPGMVIARVDDLSSSKLVLYLDGDELESIERAKIYINGLPSSAKIYKIWRESDEKYISRYRVELKWKPDVPFSSLVKVEFVK